MQLKKQWYPLVCSEEPEAGAGGGAGTSPAEQGDNTPEPKTFTEAEVSAKLRGSGSRIAELEAKIAASEEATAATAKAKADAELSTQEKLTQREAELVAERKINQSLTEGEKARTDALIASNKERNDALPESLQLVIDDGRPDLVAMNLTRLEQHAAETDAALTPGARKFQSRAKGDTVKTLDELHASSLAHMLGKKSEGQS